MQQVKCAYLFVPLLLCILITITKAEPQGVSILAKFGSPATLPCFGYGENLDLTYIDWETDSHCVFSYDEGAGDFGTKFDQRANIPKPQLRKGNFSLTIRSTKFSDAGLYRCFCSQPSYEHRLCSTVQLSISAHEDHPVLALGEDLRISLYTHEPVTVVFNTFVSVCAVEGNRLINPGPRFEGRLHVSDSWLILRAITSADQGRYEVRDQHGNVINTVKLTLRREDSAINHNDRVYILFLIFTPIIFIAFTLVLFWSGCQRPPVHDMNRGRGDAQSGVADSHSRNYSRHTASPREW